MYKTWPDQEGLVNEERMPSPTCSHCPPLEMQISKRMQKRKFRILVQMVAKTKNQNLDRLFSRKYTVVPRGPYSSSSSLCQRSVGQITGKHPLPFNQREDQTPTHYPQNKSSIDKALCEHYIHCQVAENSAKYLKRDRKKATNFGLEHFCLSFYLLF